jgi:deoxyribodipyrimidine photo-lyase
MDLPIQKEWPPMIVSEQNSLLVAPPPSPHDDNRWHGGSQAAFARIHHYFMETDGLHKYKETRNGMLRFDDSGKISPWLANGSLSPRYVYEQIRHCEQSRGANESTYWFYFELLWRDFFQFVMLTNQHGQSSTTSTPPPLSESELTSFQAWCNGNTGLLLVDAAMRELSATGYTSNRARQNVASFFCHQLKLNWRHGAAWFQHHLLDYDAASNDGNWRYLAGKGNDPRNQRVFNVIKQAEQYDPRGEYLRHWLPERFD